MIGVRHGIFYFEKIRVFKAGVFALNITHGIIIYDFGLLLLVFVG